ncbi:MAG: AAA family ATPase [Chloroflexota bacterium]|nr:AAA family ATPase [Chloroflexota bacterium]MBI5704206.1 AAA family ATPase [Chloroflexota bacterium]
MLTDELKAIIEQADVLPDEGEKQTKPRYKILSAENALQPQPPIEWIVDGLISTGSVSVFYGEGGSKKTWALLDMAVCVARGENWLNFKTKAGGVLIIDEESGSRRILRRLGDVLRGHNADNETPVYCVSLASFDFGEAGDVLELHNLINALRVQLVIIDALADVMPGRDENSVKDVQPVFLALRRIAEETQAAILIIHHSNKNGGYRGSSAIKGALDLLVSVESKTAGNEIAFKTEKARDTVAGEFFATANFMNIEPKMFWLTPSIAFDTKEFGKGERYVLRYLLVNGASEMTDIIHKADSCSERTAKNSVYSLADKGFVKRADEGGQGEKATYILTDKGKEEASKL